jgi:hypothetical protein
VAVPVKVAKPFGTCSVCELESRVWEVESSGALLCSICLRLLMVAALEDSSQPS